MSSSISTNRKRSPPTNNNNNNREPSSSHQTTPPESRRLKCFVRVRPVLASDRVNPQTPPILYRGHDGQSICISGHDPQTFDEVFSPDAPASSLIASVVVPGVADVLSGRYGCVLLYGQTGSGKTFTTAQILPAFVNSVIQIASEESAEIETKIYLECVQVYLESVHDLLDPSRKNLQLRESEDEGVFVQDASQVPIENEADFATCWEMVHRNRAVASTQLNAVSSRSHCIVTLRTTRRKRIMSRIPQQSSFMMQSGVNSVNSSFSTSASHQQQQQQQQHPLDISQQIHQHENLGALSHNNGPYSSLCILRGRMQFADLAGSERLKKSGSEGMRQVEAQCINQSLSTLGKVVHALADKHASHIPYRDSKLTRLLQDALGCGGTSSVIVTVSPNPRHSHETKLSLNFGMRAMQIVQSVTTFEAIDPHSRLVATQEWLEERVAELEKTSLKLETDRDACRTELRIYKQSMMEKTEQMNRLLEEKENEMKALVQQNILISQQQNQKKKSNNTATSTTQCNLIKEFADSFFCKKCLKKQQRQQQRTRNKKNNDDGNDQFEYGEQYYFDQLISSADNNADSTSSDDDDEEEMMKLDIPHQHDRQRRERISISKKQLKSEFFELHSSLYTLQADANSQNEMSKLILFETELRQRIMKIHAEQQIDLLHSFFNQRLAVLQKSSKTEFENERKNQQQELESYFEGIINQQRVANQTANFHSQLLHTETDERNKISKKFIVQRLNMMNEFFGARYYQVLESEKRRTLRENDLQLQQVKRTHQEEIEQLRLDLENERILDKLSEKEKRRNRMKTSACQTAIGGNSSINLERSVQCALITPQPPAPKTIDAYVGGEDAIDYYHNNNTLDRIPSTSISASCQTNDDIVISQKVRHRCSETQTVAVAKKFEISTQTTNRTNNNHYIQHRRRTSGEYWWNEDESFVSPENNNSEDQQDENVMMNAMNNTNNYSPSFSAARRRSLPNNNMMMISMGTNTSAEHNLLVDDDEDNNNSNKKKNKFVFERSTQCNIRPRKFDAEVNTREVIMMNEGTNTDVFDEDVLTKGVSMSEAFVQTTQVEVSRKKDSSTDPIVFAQNNKSNNSNNNSDDQPHQIHHPIDMSTQVPAEWQTTNEHHHHQCSSAHHHYHNSSSLLLVDEDENYHQQVTASILQALKERSAKRKREELLLLRRENSPSSAAALHFEEEHDDDQEEARQQYQMLFSSSSPHQQRHYHDEENDNNNNTAAMMMNSNLEKILEMLKERQQQQETATSNANNAVKSTTSSACTQTLCEAQTQYSTPDTSFNRFINGDDDVTDTTNHYNQQVFSSSMESLPEKFSKLILNRSSRVISLNQEKAELLLTYFAETTTTRNAASSSYRGAPAMMKSIGLQFSPSLKTESTATIEIPTKSVMIDASPLCISKSLQTTDDNENVGNIVVSPSSHQSLRGDDENDDDFLSHQRAGRLLKRPSSNDPSPNNNNVNDADHTDEAKTRVARPSTQEKEEQTSSGSSKSLTKSTQKNLRGNGKNNRNNENENDDESSQLAVPRVLDLDAPTTSSRVSTINEVPSLASTINPTTQQQQQKRNRNGKPAYYRSKSSDSTTATATTSKTHHPASTDSSILFYATGRAKTPSPTRSSATRNISNNPNTDDQHHITPQTATQNRSRQEKQEEIVGKNNSTINKERHDESSPSPSRQHHSLRAQKSFQNRLFFVTPPSRPDDADEEHNQQPQHQQEIAEIAVVSDLTSIPRSEIVESSIAIRHQESATTTTKRTSPTISPRRRNSSEVEVSPTPPPPPVSTKTIFTTSSKANNNKNNKQRRQNNNTNTNKALAVNDDISSSSSNGTQLVQERFNTLLETQEKLYSITSVSSMNNNHSHNHHQRQGRDLAPLKRRPVTPAPTMKERTTTTMMNNNNSSNQTTHLVQSPPRQFFGGRRQKEGLSNVAAAVVVSKRPSSTGSTSTSFRNNASAQRSRTERRRQFEKEREEKLSSLLVHEEEAADEKIAANEQEDMMSNNNNISNSTSESSSSVPWNPCPLGCDDDDGMEIIANNKITPRMTPPPRSRTSSSSKKQKTNKNNSKLQKQCEEALKKFGEWKQEYIHRHYHHDDENIVNSSSARQRPSSAPILASRRN